LAAHISIFYEWKNVRRWKEALIKLFSHVWTQPTFFRFGAIQMIRARVTFFCKFSYPWPPTQGTLPSISSTLNAQIFCTNFIFLVTFWLCQKIRTKNSYVKHWWNWHLPNPLSDILLSKTAGLKRICVDFKCKINRKEKPNLSLQHNSKNNKILV